MQDGRSHRKSLSEAGRYGSDGQGGRRIYFPGFEEADDKELEVADCW